VAALSILLGGTLSALADYSIFKFQNQATNGCMILQPADIAPRTLWTMDCNSAGENIVSIENNVTYFKFLFRIGVFGDERCIHVPPADLQTVPRDVNVNDCQSGTSLWTWFPSGSGLVTFHLRTVLNPDSHCLTENPTTRRVQIAECANTPEQKWKKLTP
jgi:hypothetical protein